MTDELVDIYDENLNRIGAASLDQVHNEGLWHKSFHCWIIRPTSTGINVFLRLRGDTHPIFSGLLDISAAGHLKSGEESKPHIHNIDKKWGLNIDFNKLTKLFTYKAIHNIDSYHNYEFNPTYLVETSKTLADLSLHKEDASGLFEADINDLLNLYNNKIGKIYCSGLVQDENNHTELKAGYFTKDDIVPNGDEYYLKVFNAIKRYSSGQWKFM